MGEYKKEMIRGVFWNSISRYLGIAVSIVVSAILARLISPEDFGVIAIANVIIYFLSMFTTMGIGPAIIQRRDLTQEDLNQIFTFTVIVGTLFGLVLFCCSWLIAGFYENAHLIPICQILSVDLTLSAVGMVPSGLMAKHKRFKEVSIRTIALQISSGIVSCIAAFYGLGIYSLLITPLVTSVGAFLYNWQFYPVYLRPNLTLEPVRRIFSYSLYQFLFEFFNYFSRNLDNLIIGKAMGLTSLGYYEKSYRLMQLPLQNVTGVIGPVLQPVLSSLQDDPHELAIKHSKIVRFISAISFPAAIILPFCGYELIHLFYGGNWDAAIPTFQILALSSALQMILSTSGAIFQIRNDTRGLFCVGICNTFTTVTGFVVAAIFFRTIESMAWAWNITLVVNFCRSYCYIYKRLLDTSILVFFKDLLKPTINFLLLLIFYIIFEITNHFSNTLLSLIIKASFGGIITILFIQLSHQFDILSFIRHKFFRRK